jgi:photosystem II stability/assembly factor-like uncharacterized protein
MRGSRSSSVPLLSWVAALAALLSVAAAASATTPEFAWRLRPTGTDAQLRGLDAESKTVAWASGSEGTVLRTVDGGRTWSSVGPPGTRELEFRDIEAFGRHDATILSIGTGDASRIYRTEDGGDSWELVFQNADERAFYDCIDFFDRRHGLALSDPIAGKFRILATNDGGRSYQVLPRAGMPPALEGEFAFAASGTCLVTVGRRHAWFATGGGPEARVFRSDDRGRTWSVSSTPIRSTESGGIFSLAFADKERGLAVGGDFLTPDVAIDALALTHDAGKSWSLVEDAPGGYRSGSDWLAPESHIAIAVGPTGSDVSTDGGRTWTLFDDGSFDSVDCVRSVVCWASGEAGRAARLLIGHH